MKRHAYLIIAHNEPEVLCRLLQLLDDERNDVFLHIDARSTEMNQRFASWTMVHGGFHIIEKPMCVYWGHVSQVEVEYLLMHEATSHGHYSYYHILSGVDLPLHSQDTIHRFFEEHQDMEFVGFWDTPQHCKDLQRKVRYYYPFLRYYRDRSHPLHHVTSLVKNLCVALQKLVGYRRASEWEWKKGPNWVSITDEVCRYILSKESDVKRKMAGVLCPDEIFVQTLLWNSDFRSHIYDTQDVDAGCQRLIDWNRGNPYVWQSDDESQLRNSPLMFARKFSSEWKL